MRNQPWHLLGLAPEDRSLEALLCGRALPADAAASDQFAADVLDALRAPARPDELAGFEAVHSEYATLFAAPRGHGRQPRRRPAMRPPFSHPKIATALAAGVLGLGGFGAAAYAGALPDAAQQVVHHVIGTPDSHPGKGAGHAPRQAGAPTSTPSSTPVGPDATGAAAFGLCNAYAHANEMAFEKSVAFANLAAAAGGADQIEAYCATVPHPGSAEPSAGSSDHPTGKPSTLPSHPVGPPDHPSGKPSALPSHPAGPPSSVPAGPPDHPSGKPSALPSHPAGPPSSVPPTPSGHPTGH